MGMRAQACVHSALLLLAALPGEVNECWLYTLLPLWTLLHFVMQATTVLLIHIIVEPVPVRTEKGKESGEGAASSAESPDDDVLPSCEKALHWLHHMGKGDLAWRRGFLLCHHLFCRIASLREFDLEGLPAPSSWQSNYPNHPHNYSELQSSSASAEPFLDPTHREDTDGGPATVPGMWSTHDKMFTLSLLGESGVAWFLPMPDPDRDWTTGGTG